MATEIKFVTSKEELAEVIESVMNKLEAKKKKGIGEKLYYVNQVAKLLGKSHTTIKKACENGLIRTTVTGLIPESAIEEFLNHKP
jgi:hypothetical protein